MNAHQFGIVHHLLVQADIELAIACGLLFWIFAAIIIIAMYRRGNG